MPRRAPARLAEDWPGDACRQRRRDAPAARAGRDDPGFFDEGRQHAHATIVPMPAGFGASDYADNLAYNDVYDRALESQTETKLDSGN